MPSKSNIVIGLILIMLGFSFAFPAIISSLDNTEETTFEQTQNEQIVIKGSLESISNDISNNQNYINITVINTETGSIGNAQIFEGNSETLSLSNGNVIVTNIQVTSQETALVMYQYPTYIGWPSGAQTLFENITVILIVMLVFLIAGSLIIVFEVIN